MGIAIDDLTELVTERLRVGEPTRAGGLSLYPVFHDWPAAGYLTYQEAAEQGVVTITEDDESGRVSDLRVRNDADVPVLLVEGELLVGMQQTRTLNVTVLVPAASELVVPVSCVEAGRWRRTSETATRDVYNVAPRVRASKTKSVQHSVRNTLELRSNQRQVWRDVDEVLFEHRVASPTASYADLNRSRRADIDAALAGLEPQHGQTGLVAAAGGRVVAVDVFDSPHTFERLWQSIVGSYVTEALDDVDQTPHDPGDIARWLRDLTAGTATAHPGVGSGTVVELTGSQSVGAALVTDDTVVHLAAFPNGQVREPEEAPV